MLLSLLHPGIRIDGESSGEQSMRRMSIFWGCTIPARFPFVEKATRLCADELGVELVDIAGFTCCPEGTLVKAADADAFYLTAARNLAIAEREHLPLMTPCNGCYSTFKSVLSDLTVDWRLRRLINDRLADMGLSLDGELSVQHLVEWLSEDIGPASLSKRVSLPLWGMRVAVHHGCHLLRPSPAIRWDSPLDPTKFEQLVRALGATVVEYETKMECCGGALDRVGDRQGALAMCKNKLTDMQEQGADAMVVCCPSCLQQFDLNQAAMLRETASEGLPVFYITELLALAMGFTPEELGLEMHRVSVAPFLAKWRTRLDQRAVLAESFNLADLQICASCRACDADCPVAKTNEDFVPSSFIADLLAGEIEDILERPTLWQCIDCLTCYERCHSRIGMAEVFEKLKRLAREKGRVPASAQSSYETFLASGVLGSARTSVREKLGLPPMPACGGEELKRLLAREKSGS